MKPILVDVAAAKKPIKGPFLPYISRKLLERAVRKLPRGKLKPGHPYLELQPAPWDLTQMLLLPGGWPGGRLFRCEFRSAWVTEADGSQHLAFWFDCGRHGGSPGVCSYMAIVPGLGGSLECRALQPTTCRGQCVEVHIPGKFGIIGSQLQCQCRRLI